MHLYLSRGLILSLRLCNIKDYQIISFIYDLYTSLSKSEEQLKIGKKADNFTATSKANEIRVVRGYFPNTPIMFKACMFNTPNPDSCALNIKQIVPTSSSGLGQSLIYIDNIDELLSKANAMIARKELVSDDVNNLLLPEIKMPRVMSPKGVKLFKFSKNKRGSNAKKRKI